MNEYPYKLRWDSHNSENRFRLEGDKIYWDTHNGVFQDYYMIEINLESCRLVWKYNGSDKEFTAKIIERPIMTILDGF